MTFLTSIKCSLGICRPARGSHRWEPSNYRHVAKCRHCGKRIVRTGHRKWEKLAESDGSGTAPGKDAKEETAS